jgi:colanic acid/amylovoran biosynthesis protein
VAMTEGLAILLVGNGTYANRGCEAITRGTAQIIRSVFHDPSLVSIEFGAGRPFYEPHERMLHNPIQIGRFSRAWFVQHMLRSLKTGRTWFPVIGRHLRNADAVLALGGDNYSMDYGSLRVHLALVDYVLPTRKPMVIWGASVGPFDKRGLEYEAYVLKRLSRVSAILAREDVTADYLASRGLGPIVRRVADPAFVMDPEAPRSGFTVPEGAIGFNFSPLMARYVSGGDLAQCEELVCKAVKWLSEEFSRPVVLVPHVFKSRSDDYGFLKRVEQRAVTSDHSVLLSPPTLSARETKWIIGKMTCFAGARTHSTIAAISSGVPTLSFGYSVKARGINRDVFGHENHLLLPEQITAQAVVDQIGAILDGEAEIRRHLNHRLPHIRALAFRAGTYLREVVKEGFLS